MGERPRTIRELIAARRARAEARAEIRAAGTPSDAACAFCGAGDARHEEPLVPLTMRLRSDCARCPRLPGAGPTVRACAVCHRHKRGRGLYELFRMRFPFDRRFAEKIPPGLEARYLAAITECHDCARTLDQGDIDGDGRLTVFDLDFVLHRR